MKTLTASDRKSLIRLASGMPKGSPERRAILAGLEKKGKLKLVPNDPPMWMSDAKKSYTVLRDGERIGEVVYIDKIERSGMHYTDGSERIREWQAFGGPKPFQKRAPYPFRSRKDALGYFDKLAVLKKSSRGLSSDSIKRDWKSQDSAEEQREVLGRALAGTYEVLQTIVSLSKDTEGSDTKSVQNALSSVGSAMFNVGR